MESWMVFLKNNKGFAKYELLTVLVLMMAIFSFLGFFTIHTTSTLKLDTMKRDAWSFSNAVALNLSSFRSEEVVYLEEAVDEEIFPNVKNPFGGGICDSTQSRVNTVDGKTYATLRCGDYLIDEGPFEDIKNVDIFKVSEWSDQKINAKNVEKRTLYNCKKDGEDLFFSYFEEYMFVYEYNKQFRTDYYQVKQIPDDQCKVVSKEFYRTYAKVK